MVDIHCHLLPGLDDGPARFSQAVEMAEAAYADGIRTLIATPHHGNGAFRNPASTVRTAVSHFREELKTRGVAVEVVAGQELRLSENLIGELEAGIAGVLGESRCLLIELPGASIPSCLEELLYELRIRGLTAIIAHPERNVILQRQPEHMGTLRELGALGQVTARSLLGGFGAKTGKAAWTMLHQGFIHFIATDAHDLIRRPFELTAAYRLVENRLGPAMSRRLQDNAERLVQGDEMIAALDVPQKEKGWRFVRRLFPS